jgi:Mn2+/Fe2+ NRAMP family transporter
VGAATLGGGALAATKIDPIAMLFWTAVINGIVSVPILIAMMVAISGAARLKLVSIPCWLKALGWIGTGLMSLATGLLAWSYFT